MATPPKRWPKKINGYRTDTIHHSRSIQDECAAARAALDHGNRAVILAALNLIDGLAFKIETAMIQAKEEK
jgi:hypothetical protein